MSVIEDEDLTTLSNEELMLRYVDGEVRAFEVLFFRFPNLKNWIARRTGSSEAAEDIVQQAWIKIIKGKAGYRPSAKFKTFLYFSAIDIVTSLNSVQILHVFICISVWCGRGASLSLRIAWDRQ